MRTNWSKLLRTFAITVILAGAVGSAAAQIKLQNTSKYVGGSRWDWTVFVDADVATLQKIKCVEYTLHPTFANPVRNVCDHPETKFSLSASGWGTFTIKARVRYKDGHVEDTEHALTFEKEHAPASPSVSAENWSRQIEPGWWEWGIHIKGPDTELDRIRCVEYTLHPSFPNHVRLVCTRQNGFELTARGWGTFTVFIRLLFKDGSVRQMSHQLQFQQS